MGRKYFFELKKTLFFIYIRYYTLLLIVIQNINNIKTRKLSLIIKLIYYY